MLIDGGKIKEVKIKLFLSSRSEMQKVIETARAQSITMQTFMQMPPAQITTAPLPAAQIPPTPTQTAPALPTINQLPVKTTTPDIKPPPLPPLPVDTMPSEAVKPEAETEKKDQDTESVSSKDAKRSRRGRSRSKSRSRDRSKSRERSRSRSRDRSYRSKDRYRDRRRRDRSRSRDRRDRRRYRDRSRSRDRSSRKSSRDRKRDSERIDRNSSESNNNSKNAIAPDKETELPTVPLPPSKPGFSTSGWVSAVAAEKPSNALTNPIGFSIGKGAVNTSVPNEPPVRKNEESPSLQIPLPQQMASSQPSSISHPMLLPQPPPFPQLPLEAPKDEDGRMKSMPFSPSLPPNAVTTQHSSVYMSNQPQLLQNEANKLMHQGQPAPLMMPPTWNPNMLPMVNNPHMFLGPMPPSVGMNPADKTPMPMMNVPTGMYIRPPGLVPNEKMQSPHLQNDPRMQSGFNMQQHRGDSRDNNQAPHMNNFGLQNKTTYADGQLNSPNQRGAFGNSCVEIRNMTMNTTNIDIRRFFQGLQIPGDGVKIITDKKGNKVGMAYVRFSKPIFKEMAMHKSGEMLKNSVVEILHIEDNIFDKATDFSDYQGNFFKDKQPYPDKYDNFVGMKEPTEIFTDIILHEVPPFTKDRDIYNLFKGFNVEDAFVLLRTGRKTGTGYVRFRSPAEAKRAFVTCSRLSIGYSPVKAAICYEHEFADARDRKNMEEEEDEEMLDHKDIGYTNYENRNPRNSKKYPYESEQDGPDTRYNQSDKPIRPSGHKTLLPTPNVKLFDPRAVHGNQSNNSNNFNSRFDRRQQDHPPRSLREDYNKKPNLREDFHQKPYHRESGRFQGRPPPREDFVENRRMGDTNKKPHSHNSFENSSHKQSKSDEIPQKPLNIPKANLEKTVLDSKVPIDIKKETDLEETKTKMTHETKPEQTPSDIPTPQIKEEIIVKKENEEIGREDKEDIPNDLGMESKMNFETDCIILRGLPFNANDRDILDFFSDEGLAPTQIHIMLNKLGQPAGDAFCEFNTVEEVSRALTKNRTLMGRSVVAVEPVLREEMMGALEVVVPLRQHVVPHGEFPENYLHSDYRRQDHRFPPRGRGFPNFPPRGRGRGSFRGRHNVPTKSEQETQNVNSFGKPGCVVALENVPFRAEVQDIIDFFGRYFISRDNVIRRFDENGKPTGDARVCFNSPEDANHAIRTLNQKVIFNRQIFLSLV